MSFVDPKVYAFSTTVVSAEYGSPGMSWLRGQPLLEMRDAAWERPEMFTVALGEPLSDMSAVPLPESAVS